MTRKSTVIQDLRKLQEEWFKGDSSMAATIDAAIEEIRGYRWENDFLNREMRGMNDRLAHVSATVNP